MFARAINLGLIAGLLAICAYLIPARYELARLKRELSVLERRVGNANLQQPEKCFVRLVKSGPTHFVWRLDMPATRQLQMLCGVHDMHSARWNRITSGADLPRSSLVQLAISVENGERRAHLSTPGNFSNSGFNDVEGFIWEHLSECDVSIAGGDEGTYLDAGNVIALLSIQATPGLIQRAQGELREIQVEPLSTPFVLALATPQAVANLKAKTNE